MINIKSVPCEFSYKIVCFDDDIWSQDPVLYRAESEEATQESVGQIFVEMLDRDIRKIYEEFNFPKMILSCESKKEFENAENCWICGLSLNKDGVIDKVRDHCHFMGK